MTVERRDEPLDERQRRFAQLLRLTEIYMFADGKQVGAR
jgi:hypothetical protein